MHYIIIYIHFHILNAPDLTKHNNVNEIFTMKSTLVFICDILFGITQEKPNFIQNLTRIIILHY